MRKIDIRITVVAALALLAMVALTWALATMASANEVVSVDVSDAKTTDALPPSGDLAWALAAGFLSPLAGYVLNYLGPWVDEAFKLVVQTVLAAVAGGVAQAIAVGDVGFNNTTLSYVLLAIFTAAIAHGWFKAGTVNTLFGGGRNRPTQPTPPIR